MCEPESDAARGVLSFLDMDQLFSSNYYGDSRQHGIEICHEQYARENPYHPSYCNVENDEVIAHALQEEWSELSIAGDAEYSHADEQDLQASTGVQLWHGPPRECYTGNDTGLEADDVGPSSSCSSPGDRSYDGEEYTYTLEIQNEFEIDGEVGKRINQLSAIPHVPRMNGDIPSVDEATSDHQRLLDRLQLFDLVEHKVQGDGNCQFRALSDQFYRSPEHHKFVRQQVVSQLKDHPEIYEGYVPMAYDEYLMRMSKSGEWGDHVTLQAAADKVLISPFFAYLVFALHFVAVFWFVSLPRK
ncbi:unnamed protein product [Withania somnifera]